MSGVYCLTEKRLTKNKGKNKKVLQPMHAVRKKTEPSTARSTVVNPPLSQTTAHPKDEGTTSKFNNP